MGGDGIEPDIHPYRMRGVWRYRARLRTEHHPDRARRQEMPRRRLGGGGLRGRLADRAGTGGADDAADGDDQGATAGQSGGEQEAPPSAEGSSAPSADESMDELTKLKGLLDAGVLTQDEFDAQKQKILQNM
jgi:hypothetical protein